MKKIIISLFILVYCFGCGEQNFSVEKIEASIEKALSEPVFKVNHVKRYYSYYLPPSFGRMYSEQVSNIFKYRENKILMNLNISEIIQNKYYSSEQQSMTTQVDYELFSKTGTFLNGAGVLKEYRVDLFSFNDAKILRLITDDIILYSQTHLFETDDIIHYMFQIAKSVSIDENLILEDYASKEIISGKKENIQLFEKVVPTDGNVNELFENPVLPNGDAGDEYDDSGMDTNTDGTTEQSGENFASDDYQSE